MYGILTAPSWQVAAPVFSTEVIAQCRASSAFNGISPIESFLGNIDLESFSRTPALRQSGIVHDLQTEKLWPRQLSTSISRTYLRKSRFRTLSAGIHPDPSPRGRPVGQAYSPSRWPFGLT
jgi:hypothetical protein